MIPFFGFSFAGPEFWPYPIYYIIYKLHIDIKNDFFALCFLSVALSIEFFEFWFLRWRVH